MAGAFHGPGGAGRRDQRRCFRSRCRARRTQKKAGDCDLTGVADIVVKQTAFKIARMGQLVAKEASKRLCLPLRDCRPLPRPNARRGRQCRLILEEMGLECCGAHGPTAALSHY